MAGVGEAEGRLNHLWAQGQSHCVFSKTQKTATVHVRTCQAKTFTGSSLTPHASLISAPQ